MEANYERLFKVLPPETPPTYLCERILRVVEQERTRQRQVRFVISSFSGASSFVGLVLAIPVLMHAASLRGFSSFASLLVSDGDLLSSHLSSFALPLAEALPGVEVTFTLFLLAVFLASLKSFVWNIGSVHFFKRHRVQTHQ
ncbi:hypothetical protein H0X32_02895 [Patescibacteria group bacterium]|nr:hypothetical protein [Patescibacteria group bacterium]